MSVNRLESLIWPLIFGGMIVIGLGLAVQGRDATLGWGMVIAGGIAAAIGVVLIVVRARLPDRP
jgi:hypothetical protein